MKSTIPAIAVVLGVILMLFSAAWSFIFPATRSWTEEKSQRMSDVGYHARLIDLELSKAKQSPSMHRGKSAAELQAEYDKLDAEFKQLRGEFTNASDSPKTASRILRWSGIAFVVAGGAIVFANRG